MVVMDDPGHSGFGDEAYEKWDFFTRPPVHEIARTAEIPVTTISYLRGIDAKKGYARLESGYRGIPASMSPGSWANFA